MKFLFLFLFLSFALFGEEIHLKNNEVLTGEILSQTESGIVVRFKDGETKSFQRNEIKKIQYSKKDKSQASKDSKSARTKPSKSSDLDELNAYLKKAESEIEKEGAKLIREQLERE